VKRGGVE